MGLACGDAVGTALEFEPKDSFEPISDMVGGGPFYLEPGEWTDDTSMALCLAESLIAMQGFDAEDQMTRYCKWWQQGYLSSNGSCFDIGGTVQSALSRFSRSREPFSGSTDPRSAGNGSLMRLAPVPLYFYPDLDSIIEYAGQSSRTTHGSQECIDACRYFATLLCSALDGLPQMELLTTTSYVPEAPKIAAIAAGSFIGKSREEINGTGYVVDALEAALWCFFNTASFEEAILLAANLGDDADTTAAICGQLAGAYYGVHGIPSSWLDKLVMRSEIAAMSLSLLRSA